jgi:dTDP-glucose 4,6-dehydratase
VINSIVTGGAGFLGSHLADVLAERGDSVAVVDNLTTGRLGNLERAISSGRVTFIYGDVAVGPTPLRGLLAASGIKKIDYIYHLASHSPGTMSLIEIALEHQARFVYCSTAEVYGDPFVREPSDDSCEHLASSSRDDEAKRIGEAAVAAAVKSRGLDARVVRFYNCYGPRMRNANGRLIPALLEAAANRRPLPIAGTGKQTGSMMFVADAIKLLPIVAGWPQGPLQPVNVGVDDELSVIDIARSVARFLHVDFTPQYVSARAGEPQRRRPDFTQARALGWKPSTSLEKGLQVTSDWFSRESRLFI